MSHEHPRFDASRAQSCRAAARPTRTAGAHGERAAALLSLQRAAGNRAVTSLVRAEAGAGVRSRVPRVVAQPRRAASTATVQRNDDSCATTVQRNHEAETPAVVGRLEDLQTAVANGVTIGATPYQEELPALRQRMGQKFGMLDDRFKDAHGAHTGVLKKAKESAEDFNFWSGIVIGAAASLVAGAAIGAVPFVAAAKVGGALWWTAQGVSAAASTAGGAVGTGLVQRNTNFESVMPSNLMEVEGLKSLLGFERQATDVLSLAIRLAQVHIYATDWLNAIRNPASFGMTAAEAEAHATRFERQARGAATTAVTLPIALQALFRVKSALEKWAVPSRRQLEQAIWVYWIKKIDTDDHDKLDEDELEDYLHGPVGVLGRSGVLGVDTRKVWDTYEEMLAINKARAQWSEVRAALAGPSGD